MRGPQAAYASMSTRAEAIPGASSISPTTLSWTANAWSNWSKTLRELVADGEVTIEAKRIRFKTGQWFQDFITEIKADYKRDEVEP